MLARPMAAVTLLLCALLLLSCAGEPVPVVVKTPLPAEFSDCKARPVVPAAVDDAIAAGLLLDYDDAWADCRDKLQRAWGLTQ